VVATLGDVLVLCTVLEVELAPLLAAHEPLYLSAQETRTMARGLTDLLAVTRRAALLALERRTHEGHRDAGP